MLRFLVVLASLFFTLAKADSGPQFQSLEVTRIYNDGGQSYYIEFNDGSMPGCFSERGGRLLPSNPLFDQTYSMVLTMMAVGGVKGAVNFKDFQERV